MVRCATNITLSWLTVALSKISHQFAIQLTDNVIGNLAALVIAFIDDRAFLVLLRKEVTSEVRVARSPGIRKPDVRQSAVGKPVDGAAIVFDPCARAQTIFVGDGDHGHDA